MRKTPPKGNQTCLDPTSGILASRLSCQYDPETKLLALFLWKCAKGRRTTQEERCRRKRSTIWWNTVVCEKRKFVGKRIKWSNNEKKEGKRIQNEFHVSRCFSITWLSIPLMWLQVIIFPESTTVSHALRFEQTRLANEIARSCIKILNFICLCVRFFCGFIYLAVSLDTFDGRSIFGSHVCFFSRQLVSSTSIINSNESINCKGWTQTCYWQW